MHAACGSTSGTAALVAHAWWHVIFDHCAVSRMCIVCVDAQSGCFQGQGTCHLGHPPSLQSDLIRISQVASLATCTPDEIGSSLALSRTIWTDGYTFVRSSAGTFTRCRLGQSRPARLHHRYIGRPKYGGAIDANASLIVQKDNPCCCKYLFCYI